MGRVLFVTLFMNLQELKEELRKLRSRYQRAVIEKFNDQRERLDFFNHPKFSTDILMTKKGDYAVIIFTTRGEDREFDNYSDPGIIDVNVKKRAYEYEKTGDYITTLAVNDKNFPALNSVETTESLIDNRLYLMEQRKGHTERESITFILKEKKLEETLGYLTTAEENFCRHTPQSYSDCKNNCRKAVDSMLEKLINSKNFDQITWIGEKEKETFKKIQSLNAKHGSHTPTPQKEDAFLALSLTKSIIRFTLEKQN